VPVGPSALYLYLHTVGHALRGVRLAAAGLELADTLQRARDEVTALLEASERVEGQLLQLGRGHAAARSRLRNLAVALERLAGGAAAAQRQPERQPERSG
jgi:DNA anti-recombination protein RmuC